MKVEKEVPYLKSYNADSKFLEIGSRGKTFKYKIKKSLEPKEIDEFIETLNKKLNKKDHSVWVLLKENCDIVKEKNNSFSLSILSKDSGNSTDNTFAYVAYAPCDVLKPFEGVPDSWKPVLPKLKAAAKELVTKVVKKDYKKYNSGDESFNEWVARNPMGYSLVGVVGKESDKAFSGKVDRIMIGRMRLSDIYLDESSFTFTEDGDKYQGKVVLCVF